VRVESICRIHLIFKFETQNSVKAFQKSFLSNFENILGLIFDFNLKPWS
jgi:hypothetical protein